MVLSVAILKHFRMLFSQHIADSRKDPDHTACADFQLNSLVWNYIVFLVKNFSPNISSY